MSEVIFMEKINEISSRLHIDISQIDLSSVSLPPGDDFGIISDDEDLYQEDGLEFDAGFSNVIVVDNVPVVPREKFQKLEGVVRKLFGQIGVIKNDGLHMPVDPNTDKTLGYCFIEYNTPQEAELAKEKIHSYKLDKSHIFAVSIFDDFDRFMKVPDKWAAPEIKPYIPGENLQQWLTDAKGRDQFVIRAGSNTEVLWNDARQLKPELVYKRDFWTESFVQWSPLGLYLATLHRQGAAVWGGATSFNRLMRYAHPQVKMIDFSPGEKFLVTFSSHEPNNPLDTHRVVLNVFDVRTGKVMRDFRGNADDFAIGGTDGVSGISWPVFRWCGGQSDKYFARIGKNVISVYETDTFTLIDKKSMKIDNVVDFCWSPTDPLIALYVPELGGGNQPARVSLVQIPSKEELRQKNLFNVSDCKLYWQSNGDYLAVKVERYTKTKKSTYTGFELFHIKERNVPIEVFELENKNEKIVSFAWEPKGHRFAVIHGDGPKHNVSFYSMRNTHSSNRVSKLTTLKDRNSNAIFWSPAGQFLILAELKSFSGHLEFYNVEELETMTTTEHFGATNILWDPTGRYVATVVTSVHEMENGFSIWSFSGKLLYRIMRDHFFQFLWRPRPRSLLSAEKEEEIAKNLKKYSKRFEAEDADVSVLLSEQDREKRKAVKEEWERWVKEWREAHETQRAEILRDGLCSEEEDEYVETDETEVEQVFEEIREILPNDPISS